MLTCLGKKIAATIAVIKNYLWRKHCTPRWQNQALIYYLQDNTLKLKWNFVTFSWSSLKIVFASDVGTEKF